MKARDLGLTLDAFYPAEIQPDLWVHKFSCWRILFHGLPLLGSNPPFAVSAWAKRYHGFQGSSHPSAQLFIGVPGRVVLEGTPAYISLVWYLSPTPFQVQTCMPPYQVLITLHLHLCSGLLRQNTPNTPRGQVPLPVPGERFELCVHHEEACIPLNQWRKVFSMRGQSGHLPLGARERCHSCSTLTL